MWALLYLIPGAYSSAGFKIPDLFGEILGFDVIGLRKTEKLLDRFQ